MFSIGILLGTIIGIILASTLLSSKISDLESEIGDLRVQRKLLKEEIKKMVGEVDKDNTGQLSFENFY